MPRRRGPGRPRNKVPTIQLGVRIKKPIWRRVMKAAEQQEKPLGQLVEELLDQALPPGESDDQ